MKDALFIIGMLLRHVIEYPIAVVADWLWFDKNFRPKWMERRRTRAFARLDADKIRSQHIRTKIRFWIKKMNDNKDR